MEYSAIQQQRAYVLLIELLAYQFCSPVRWIETQDVLLGQQEVERLIEIGPGKTLNNMAKRTVELKYTQSDLARGLQRLFVGVETDHDSIYYREDQIQPDDVSLDHEATSQVTQVPVHGVRNAVSNSEGSAASSGLTGTNKRMHPDAPVTIIERFRAIVANTMRKPLAAVPMDGAIRSLAAGRSTIQNETIGNLEKEFGTLPAGAEDMKLEDICSAVRESTSATKLGAHALSIIDRMISTKMPASTTIRSVRKNLQQRWSLPEGRQDSVLLLATALQPSHRCVSDSEASEFIDTVVSAYMKQVGIRPLSLNKLAQAESVNDSIVVDAAVLEHLREDQRTLNQRLMKAYAESIQRESNASGDQMLKVEQQFRMAQAALNSWVDEHGETYRIGMLPKFDPHKVRSYDSSWNWGTQALHSTFYKIMSGVFSAENVDQGTLENRFLRNQVNERHLRMMYHLRKRAQKASCLNKGPAKTNGFAAESWISGLIKLCLENHGRPPITGQIPIPTQPKTTIDERGFVCYSEAARTQPASWKERKDESRLPTEEVIDHCAPSWDVQIKKKQKRAWITNDKLTHKYKEALDSGMTKGHTFSGMRALVTGASKDSIGLGILKGLLSGGAHVVITTRSPIPKSARFFQKVFKRYGSLGSRLVLVPFNQGSRQDVDALISWIYNPIDGLGWDLDYIVPFAALPETGRDISHIDSGSELAHRVMLTNVIRIMGQVKAMKQKLGIVTRPAQVILPLSPNHGIFGHDGLYAESKLALEATLNKWLSEGWGHFLSICGACIGWTRGTGLMSSNNFLAEGIENLGVRTYSQEEMAMYILALMSPGMVSLCQSEPLVADLTGGMDAVDDFDKAISTIRDELNELSAIRRAIAEEDRIDSQIVNGNGSAHELIPGFQQEIRPRIGVSLGFPDILSFEEVISPLKTDLLGMVDLDQVVVIVGHSEIGPWGSSRVRWNMESHGELSPESCIEMAWMMGLIEYRQGNGSNEMQHQGWVDSKTKKPIDDAQVKARYESEILKHAGVRLVLQEDADESANATTRECLQEVVLEDDLEPFTTSAEVAQHFKERHGSNVQVRKADNGGGFNVHLRKGASVLLPKAPSVGRRVAGTIPTGWDARTYGISEDIIAQVDKVTLYSLVCTVDALLSAGVRDPYEFYQHIHTSEVGICIGSGAGPISSISDMHKGRFLDETIQSDILQETFINTTGAWINMLLLSSNGPIRTPVGACATSLESLDAGHELITSGKAKMCLVGGFDDLQDDVAFEFGNLKATVNAEADLEKGRAPDEMSRPATTSRAGFVESQGCGMQILTSASLALEMGLPIYAVVALTQTASDKIGRSVPAPGQGILAASQESESCFPSPMLEIRYRKRIIDHKMAQVVEDEGHQIRLAHESNQLSPPASPVAASQCLDKRLENIRKETRLQVKHILRTYNHEFWRDEPSISPIRGALATWGLTIDDLGVASCHGTSTVKGDYNELEVLNRQLAHLGRTPGNLILTVFQKYLTGHPKGAAGAWMLNSCLQILNSGSVPGNRNLDNVDDSFKAFEHLAFLDEPIQTDGVKAFSLTSFGFGQKGAQAIGVHPKYLFATLDKERYMKYQERVLRRKSQATAEFQSRIISNKMFSAKEKPPYTTEDETSNYLNPTTRFPWQHRREGL
ncbi:putative 3-oxoacyl-synthase [Sarocladium strictum]